MTIIYNFLIITLFIICAGCGSSTKQSSVNSSDVTIINYNLAVEFTGGSLLGNVAIEPNGISCSSNCINTIANGSTLKLTAQPVGNAIFSGWSGACEGTSSCNLSMTSNKNVTANFTSPPPITFTLYLNQSLGGTLKVNDNVIDCIDGCQLSFQAGETIHLSAQAKEGYEFGAWSNECMAALDCIITITKDSDLFAQFSQSTPPLNTLTVETIGSGTISIENTNDSCTERCDYLFEQGQVLTLNATPANGYTFSNWQGACEGQTICQFSLDDDSSVSAVFIANLSLDDSNAITITEPHGKPQSHYPIQIGRPFAKGEIVNYPQAVIDGKDIDTQADIKQRYDDGSVKHAILSFIIDELPANGTIKISFTNTEQNNNTPLNEDEMLSNKFNFDARMDFLFDNLSNEQTASARDMLEQGDFEYWTSGPIATTILLKDHSIARKYDVGSDDYRSVRPLFYVTFWPSIGRYSVRYIAEAINTESLQDQNYGVSLSIGSDTPFYQNNAIHHQAMSRWTKKYWSGSQLSTLSINHNIKYLTKTFSIPNFDTSRVVSENMITTDWNKWLTKDKDLYQKGLWQSAMSTAGGRPDIGLYPSWTVKWLFTGDWRYQEIALTQSELASAWPMHLREGRNTLKFDFNNEVNAIGKIISMAPEARPTHWTDRPQWHEINENDKIYFVNPNSNPRTNAESKTEWRPDTAHHPDISSPQYLLTGDYFYLEEMLFSAAFVSGNNNAKGYKSSLGRGPTGSEGGLYSGEVRGQAWALRTRLNAYDITPDSFSEKNYFDTLNLNAISMWEGLMNLPLTNIDNQDLYQFVKDNVAKNEFKKTKVPSVIGLWDEGVSSASYVRSDRVNTNNVSQALAPWMQNFVIIALGRAKEIGYNTDQLLSFAGNQLLQPFTDPNTPHWMISAYIMPTLDKNNQWLTSWDEVFSQFLPSYIDEVKNFVSTNLDSEHGYPGISMAAASYLDDHENFPALWKYIEDNIATKSIYDDNPKWALLPR